MIKNETAEITSEKAIAENNAIKFKGHFVSVTGKRKTSVANARIYKKGEGIVIINNKKINDYFKGDKANIAKQPLKLTGHIKDLNISVNVKGGGTRSQVEAVKHALSRGLVLLDSELRPALKAKKFLTRDARMKERKKPGLKRARRAPQWSKR